MEYFQEIHRKNKESVERKTPTMYAVKKVGGVRAKSVHTSEEDAKANLPPKDYVIEVRHGERTRCKSYCQVAGFCSQYKRYLAENPQE